jgi:hypothetical protein
MEAMQPTAAVPVAVDEDDLASAFTHKMLLPNA